MSKKLSLSFSTTISGILPSIPVWKTGFDIDQAADYQYCMVFENSREASKKIIISYIKAELEKNGFLLLDYNNGANQNDHEDHFILINIPLNVLQTFAEEIGFKMMANPDVLKTMTLNRGVRINHLPNETHQDPYHYIFIPYKRSIPDSTYWRRDNGRDEDAFWELMLMKLCTRKLEKLSFPTNEIRKYVSTIGELNEQGINQTQYNIKDLLRKGVITDFFPLHNPRELRTLRQDAVDLHRLPWMEPFHHVREYCGEKIALYFAFMSFFLTWLTIPSIICIPLQVIVFTSHDYSNPVVPPFSAFIVFWAIIMLENWKRKEKTLAMKWGMIGFESSDEDRPEFRGKIIESYISGEPMVYFPTRARIIRMAFAATVAFTVMCIAVSCVTGIYVLRYLKVFGQFIASIINLIQIQFFNIVYRSLAKTLTNFENQRTDIEYEDSLITKLFVFQFFNSYASFFYLAFLAELVGDCQSSNCMSPLVLNLGVIFGIRIVGINFLAFLFPWFEFRFRRVLRGAYGHSDFHKKTRPEQEYMRPKFDIIHDSIRNYMSTAIEFGYMLLFSAALPMSSVCLLLASFIQSKADMYKLIKLFQRPEPHGVEDIGQWQYVFTAVSVAGVLSNAGIVVHTMTVLDTFRCVARNSFISVVFRMWVFIGFVLLAILIQVLSMIMIPDVPAAVNIQIQRNDFILGKIFGVVKSDDEANTD